MAMQGRKSVNAVIVMEPFRAPTPHGHDTVSVRVVQGKTHQPKHEEQKAEHTSDDSVQCVCHHDFGKLEPGTEK